MNVTPPTYRDPESNPFAIPPVPPIFLRIYTYVTASGAGTATLIFTSRDWGQGNLPVELNSGTDMTGLSVEARGMPCVLTWTRFDLNTSGSTEHETTLNASAYDFAAEIDIAFINCTVRRKY